MFCYTQTYLKEIHKLADNPIYRALEGKTVFLTGATGLIGSAVADLLIELNENFNLNVRIILSSRKEESLKQRFYPFIDRKYLEFIQYDVSGESTFHLHGADFVIHAAGNSHPSLFRTEPVETMKANLNGLERILMAVKEENRKKCRVLYVSSSEIYGRIQNRNELLQESSAFTEVDSGYVDILDVRSCYPMSKRTAETLLVSYIYEYGIDGCIVRPGHIYGPTQTESDSRASAQFLRQGAAGTDIVMKSRGEQLRSYCHCFDCASALLTIMIKGNTKEAYNISNRNSVITIKRFAELCASFGGGELCFKLPGEEEKKSYNRMECSALNAEKLEALGWQGVYGAEEGIRQSIEILKESAFHEKRGE